MVTVEINTDILIILWIFFTICLFIVYVFERQDARLYKRWYDDMWHKWSKEMRENIELKEKLYQREEEED